MLKYLCGCSVLCFIMSQRKCGGAAGTGLVQVHGGVWRWSAGGGARGLRRVWRQNVIAGNVLVSGRRGRRRWRCVRVVRAGVGTEAGHGQRGAVRGRAHGRLARCRASRQWGRVVQRAHRRLPPDPGARSTSIRLRRGLCCKLYTFVIIVLIFFSSRNTLTSPLLINKYDERLNWRPMCTPI